MILATTLAPARHHPSPEALLVVQRMFDAFSTGDAGAVDDICAPDLVEHQFGLAGAGPKAIRHVKDAVRDHHRAVPNMVFTIEDATPGPRPGLGPRRGPRYG